MMMKVHYMYTSCKAEIFFILKKNYTKLGDDARKPPKLTYRDTDFSEDGIVSRRTIIIADIKRWDNEYSNELAADREVEQCHNGI